MHVKREYVVQYRKVGNRRWVDSHITSFPRKPDKKRLENEFFESACDLVCYPRDGNLPYLTGDFEVRTVKREIIHKETPLAKVTKFKNKDIKKAVQRIATYDVWR